MADITINGANLIGGLDSALGSEPFSVTDRRTGDPLPGAFAAATEDEVAQAAAAAAKAFQIYSGTGSERRAEFLDAIAAEIEALGDPLIERAVAESGLPPGRITGERGRTCGQLRMFAALIREGSWVDVRIDRADPNRMPPKPEIRRMLVPIGPVAVFGASNFPLAFSVAGGDTASALAAGCPVVVKAHPAHPGTCELVGRAIAAAAEATGMPAGVFGMLHGGAAVGRSLVLRPEIYAVGFTGSQRAGRALYDLGASRPRPIPVFAEMGSVNPVVVLPGALAERAEAIGRGYAESLTLGVGQFCTNPGIVVGLAGAGFDQFLSSVKATLASVAPGVMLTGEIGDRYRSAVAERSGSLTRLSESANGGESLTEPAVFVTTASEFLSRPELTEEVFGPAGIAVGCESATELELIVRTLEGQLTATVHAGAGDETGVSALLPILARIAGRVVYNGFPTGVEVGPAMQHGGPYPATTDSRSTSVGTAAILRWVRPVALQNVPNEQLPPQLREENPLRLRRLVDGKPES